MPCCSSGELIATGVPPEHAHLAWPELWPLLQPAYALVPVEEQRDLLAGVQSRNLTLWAIYRNDKAIAGIVTRPLDVVGTSSTETHCQIWLIGGARLIEWAADFLKILKPWAAENGFASIIAAGSRREWRRVGPRLAAHLGMTFAFMDGPNQYWRLGHAF